MKKDMQREAEILISVGMELFFQGQPLKAIEKWLTAKAIFEKLEMADEVAQIERQIGLTLGRRGLRNQREALSHLENAKKIYEELKEPEKKAELEELIGISLNMIDQHTKAIKYYDAASTFYKKTNQYERIADMEKNIGNALCGLGQYKEALKRFDAAKKIYEEQKSDSSKIATIDHYSGNAYHLMGKLNKALNRFNEAKRIYENNNDELHTARILGEIGKILSEKYCFESALENLNLASDIFKKLRRFEEAVNNENQIAIILSNQDKHDEALQKYKAVLHLWEYLDSPQHQAVALRNIGISNMKLGDYEGASLELNKAFKLMELVRSRVKSPELQRSLREQYLIVSDALCVNSILEWEKSGLWGFLNDAINDLELSKSSQVAETIELGGGIAPCSEVERLTVLEDELLNKWEENFHKRAENRKLEIEGQIDQHAFKNTSNDLDKECDVIQKEVDKLRSEVLVKCVDYGIAPIPRTYNILERAFKLFPRGQRWCIIEFAISDVLKRLIVFLITAVPNMDGTPGIFCELNQNNLDEIRKLSNRCRKIIVALRELNLRKWAKANEELKALSKELYSTLIPKEIGIALKRLTEQTGIEHLIVIPHKFLHYVPFEILHDGDEYWGIKYALSTNFSLDLARICIEKRKESALAQKKPPLFLMVKNPLNDLHGADKSVEELSGLLDANNIKFEELKHKDATQDAFVEYANRYPFNVLHYAGHGVYMGKYPDKSALFLHTYVENCKSCENGLRHDKWDLLNATEFINNIKFQNTPIVFLLGCETGIVKVENGDEMFGLSRALMYAGATSLILSRWIVRGNIAPNFSTEFYRWLLSGASVAVALRNARCKVYTSEEPNFTDWAAFFLSGDPFRTLS